MSKEEETAMAMEDIKTDGIDSAWEGTSCQTIEEQDPSQVALSSSLNCSFYVFYVNLAALLANILWCETASCLSCAKFCG
jgi:hypothetical protein